MKKSLLSIFGIVLISGLNSNFATADQVAESVEVEIPVKALLTPYSGYEEKNTIQAVLYGTLPSACYTLGNYLTERNDSNHTIRVRQFATQQISGVCADEANLAEHQKMIVPFSSEVHVGNLPAGNYKFIFNQPGGKPGFRMMNVAPNTTMAVDTLPYAVVSEVSSPDVVDGKQDVQVTLSGVLNSSCIQLDDQVKVFNEDDVSVVMPTVSVKTGVLCIQVLIPYEKRVNLGKIPAGTRLIHARSMNGRAINKVIQVSR